MALPDSALFVLIPVAALVVFPLSWLGASALVARFGGWRSLARDYAREGTPPGEDLGLCSLSLSRGPLFATNYNGAAHVGLGPEGLTLWTSFLFRRSHPPLLIPWERVGRCERRRLLFVEVTAVAPRESALEILIRGAAGERVFEYWQGRGRPGRRSRGL